ncbi:MAG: hypothetical protein SF029_01015 [bacterium]|jgi:hypothetical protein|nr:hypothetical protein [bacterium]
MLFFDTDFILLCASTTALLLGLLHLVDPAYAWSLHELDLRFFMNRDLKKADNWRERISMYGSFLIFTGGLGIMVAMNLI